MNYGDSSWEGIHIQKQNLKLKHNFKLEEIKMTMEFYKEQVQKLQQKVDEQYEMIKHLKNELSLC